MQLYKPKLEELNYRMNLMSDPQTMSYNKDLDLDFEGYHKDTGCIDFPRDTWKTWYDYWMEAEPTRFYAYLKVKDQLVGEVALRYVEAQGAHMINIIIDSRHRGKGYGKEGLQLLLKVAFKDLNLEKVIDDFPITRTTSINLFQSLGFHSQIKDNLITFSLTKSQYHALNI